MSWLARFVTNPWSFGPYRVVVTRRVTEEEQISVECYEPSVDKAISTYEQVMVSMRSQMIAHNERVILVYKTQLSNIERAIENKGDILRDLDSQIEARQEQLSNGVDVNETE